MPAIATNRENARVRHRFHRDDGGAPGEAVDEAPLPRPGANAKDFATVQLQDLPQNATRSSRRPSCARPRNSTSCGPCSTTSS